ncbi:hypothetical protein PF006_g20109 [Phytophthora fragariae]|uniref:Uncharacterized protein n=1 Tax=Phytophthora fragariae TaxID=53985 RepID=A0A6A3SGU7_9STRA|nr:hypothetical protein PF003_g2953 [Phytophthora fragariae]KAE9111886.1 hypothetical protein PF006_g20109 [Phytophthora fragariae]
MHATERPRTLLLASRSLPCSSADAATNLAAAVAHKTNAERSLATPPTSCIPPPTTNLASGRAQLAFRGDVPCKMQKRRMRVSHARRPPDHVPQWSINFSMRHEYVT